MNKAIVASLKERSELLLEQMDKAKRLGKDDSQKFRDMQQCYIKTSQAYVVMVDAENRRRMKEFGIVPSGKTKPLTEDQLRSLGLSEQTIGLLKGVGIGNQAG